MIELFNQGWFGSLTGLLGFVVGLIGIILYLRSRIGGRPTCLMETLRLISMGTQELPEEVKILYKGDEVPRLSLTHAYFWNSGKATIGSEQMVENDPLCFTFDGSDEILKADIATSDRYVNKFSVTVPPDSKNKARVAFDFIDPNDGARIDLLHTSQNSFPRISGTFRGIPKGIIDLTFTGKDSVIFSLSRSLARNRNLILAAMLIIGLLTFSIALLPSEIILSVVSFLRLKSGTLPIVDLTKYRMVFAIAGILYIIMPAMLLLIRRKKYPSALDNDRKKEAKEPEHSWRVTGLRATEQEPEQRILNKN